MARLGRRFRLGWRCSKANHGRKPGRGKPGYTFARAGARPIKPRGGR